MHQSWGQQHLSESAVNKTFLACQHIIMPYEFSLPLGESVWKFVDLKGSQKVRTRNIYDANVNSNSNNN
eukprot:369385-Amphidinium_carterae.1